MKLEDHVALLFEIDRKYEGADYETVITGLKKYFNIDTTISKLQNIYSPIKEFDESQLYYEEEEDFYEGY